jgi:hypothetical protein
VRFAVRDHQGKSKPFVTALLSAGHERSEVDDADFILIDYDLPHPAYNAWFDTAKPLIVYPHGFSATWAWDLIGESVGATAAFVPGTGQKRLLELYEYPTPVHAIGWPGPRATPKPRECKKVVFAPIHPLGSGWLHSSLEKANAEAFQCLLDEPFELVVRHIGSLEQNGLWQEPGVRYINGALTDGVINVADVVVAQGTYAAHCIAHGVPVVMFHQAEWGVEREPSTELTYPPGWEAHQDFVRYPYDLAPGVCQEAAESPDVSEWRDHFLGPEFDANEFVRLVEREVKDAVAV